MFMRRASVFAITAISGLLIAVANISNAERVDFGADKISRVGDLVNLAGWESKNFQFLDFFLVDHFGPVTVLGGKLDAEVPFGVELDYWHSHPIGFSVSQDRYAFDATGRKILRERLLDHAWYFGEVRCFLGDERPYGNRCNLFVSGWPADGQENGTFEVLITYFDEEPEIAIVEQSLLTELAPGYANELSVAHPERNFFHD